MVKRFTVCKVAGFIVFVGGQKLAQKFAILVCRHDGDVERKAIKTSDTGETTTFALLYKIGLYLVFIVKNTFVNKRIRFIITLKNR